MYIKEFVLENATSTFAAISAVLLSQDDGLSDDWRLSKIHSLKNEYLVSFWLEHRELKHLHLVFADC